LSDPLIKDNIITPQIITNHSSTVGDTLGDRFGGSVAPELTESPKAK